MLAYLNVSALICWHAANFLAIVPKRLRTDLTVSAPGTGLVFDTNLRRTFAMGNIL